MLLKDVARQRATSVREAYWSRSFPVNPYVIARGLGLRVILDYLPENTSGMIIKRPGTDPDLYVEITDSLQRQNFTIAHEIGHFIERTVVQDKPDDEFSFVERRGGPQTMHEFFANEFAGNLLMPTAEVRSLRNSGFDQVRMAKEFDVSVPAMALRLKRIDLEAHGDQS